MPITLARPDAVRPEGSRASRAGTLDDNRSTTHKGTLVVMVLPFVMALLAAVLACLGRARLALAFGLATVIIQMWWLIYHATDALKIAL